MSLTVIIPPTDVSPTTGTGNAVLATSPTLTTPISATLTSPASTNLTLGTGSFGTALTVASATGLATFAGAVNVLNALTTANSLRVGNAGSNVFLAAENDMGGSFVLGSTAYAGLLVSQNPLQISVNNGGSVQATISSTGLAVTGTLSATTGAAVGGATAGAGGLAFPATAVGVANPNPLDDYEEGTWTPTVAGATTAGTVAYSPSSQNGYYTKIGRLLYVWFDLDVSSFSGGVGGLTITNLPFPNANITNFYPTFQPWVVASAYAQTYTTPTGSINPNSSVLILYSTDDGHANFASMNVNQTGRIAGYLMMQTT